MTDTGRQHGPTGIPWRTYLRPDTVYHDALPCPITRGGCGMRARAGGCGDPGCPFLRFKGAGLPGMMPWETNHP